MRAALWYAATRAFGLALLVWPESVLLHDATNWLVDLDRLGPMSALPEYPWPTALLAFVPMALGVPTILHYYAAIVLFVLAVDALFAWWLWRAGGRVMSYGLWVWLLAFPALGPLMVTRLDMIPTVLAAGALLALSRPRPATAGALAALGAGFKLWPAVALPGLLVPGSEPERGRVLAGFAICGAALALATLAAAGSARLWSPLALQGERGLQIEAFAALPLLWLRYLIPGSPWSVAHNSACNCHELYGPGVPAAIAFAMLAMLAAAAGLVALHVRAFRTPSRDRTAATAAVLTALGVVAWLMTGRVFSPQYMIWLAGPLAVAGVLSEARLDRASVALFAAAGVLTHLVYPLGYEALITERHFLQAPVLAILTMRDALVVALAARLTANLWRATGATA